MNGEKSNGKNHIGWFSGHHSRNSTIITTSSYKQGIPSTLPTYSWTFTPIPNWTCSVVTVPLSDARPSSMWLTVARIPVRNFKTPIWKDCWLQSSWIHPHDEDQEDAWSQNPTVQIHNNFVKRKRWNRSRTLSPITICLEEFTRCLCNLCTVLRLLKQFFYMFKVRRKESPKTDSRIPRKSDLDSKILKSRQIWGVEKLSISCWALMKLQSLLDFLNRLEGFNTWSWNVVSWSI